MPDGMKTNNASKTLSVFVKIGMIIGGAWLVFGLFSDISMNILQRINDVDDLSPQFIVDLSFDYVSKISLAIMLIISAILSAGKVLNVLWTCVGGIYVVNVFYSIYKYLWYSVNFFKNYNFSFDGIIKICESLLYLSFVCSVVFVCFYCGNISPRKIKRTAIVFSLLGIVYLFSMLVISFFKGGELLYKDILESSLKFITFGSFFAFGFWVDHTPKNDPVYDFSLSDSNDEENPLNLEEITTIIDDFDGTEIVENDIISPEIDIVNENPGETVYEPNDEGQAEKDETVVDDLLLMNESISFEKDDSIMNNILQEIYDNTMNDYDDGLPLNDASTLAVDGSVDANLDEELHFVNIKLSSNIDE